MQAPPWDGYRQALSTPFYPLRITCLTPRLRLIEAAGADGAGKDEEPEGGGGGAIEDGKTSGLGAESGLPEEGRWVPTSSGLGKIDSG